MKKKVHFLRGAVFTAMLFAVLSCGGGAGWTPEYDVGDTGPGGGKIFYVSAAGFGPGNTWHYLEAAPANISEVKDWASSSFGSTLIGGTKTDIGTGAANTTAILGTDVAAPAALACRDYNYGGKTDWFLPSKDELNAMYQKISLPFDSYSFYRSSSEYSDTVAWAQASASSGPDTNHPKIAVGANHARVRPIRAF